MEEIKISWKSKYSADLPPEFISRLECELSKYENDPEAGTNHGLTSALEVTKINIRELNTKLRNEEYFFEILSAVISSRKDANEAQPSDASLSDMYAKVNKPGKVNRAESPKQNIDKVMTDTKPVRLPSQGEGLYEEIEYRNAEINKLSPRPESKKKMRGSVKDKIKMFDRSDSSSGDENKSTVSSIEGDYARLAVKPPVSPKPSPASKRRPRDNEYEEINLPFLATNKKQDVPSNSSIQSQQSAKSTDKPYADIKSVNDSLNKKEGYACLSDQLPDNKLNETQHVKGQAPPVPLRRSRGKETSGEKLSETPSVKYSDCEPQLSSSLKHKQVNESAKNHSGAHKVNEPCYKIDDSSGGIEGEYCSIKCVNTDNKHVTRVQVTNDKGNEKDKNPFGKHNHSFKIISVSGPNKELSRSSEDLARSKPERLKRESSKSSEDITKEDHYAELNFSTTKSDTEEPSSVTKMKKLFGLKEGSDLKSDGDADDQVIGKNYKSLSSNSGSEEDLGKTVLVDIEGVLDKKEDNADSVSEPKVKEKMRNRIPDYEKWTFQTLLTQTGISVAENENLTDGGSDEETPYDNVNADVDKSEAVSGHSDDSGVCESGDTSSTPDEKEKPYVEVTESEAELEPGRCRPKASETNSNVGSRISTASTITVNGDSVFQRCDSYDGQAAIPEDTASVYSDDQVERGDLEDNLKADSSQKRRKTEQLHMRQLVVRGILESEKAYLGVIEQLVKAKHYLHSAALNQGNHANPINLEDVTTIFYKLEDIYQIHKEFIGELTRKVQNWSDDQRIADAVKRLVVYFKAYEEYVSNYPIALETIRKYQRNEETRHLLEEHLESYKDENLKLEDVLLKPVQRIQTNHLVLHDLIKHTPEDHLDYPILTKALKLSEENLRMYNANLGNPSCSKTPEARQLVKSGFLVEVSRDKKASRQLRYVFLFSDIIVCTKHKGSNRYRDNSFKYLWYLPLPSLSILIRGDKKYAPQESLDDLKIKIGNLKCELRDEMIKVDTTKDKAFSILQKRATRNIEKLKKKIQEQEATLVEALPRLPLHLEVEGFRPHTFLFSTDYEREEWREALETQHIKCEGMPQIQFSNHDIDAMIISTKLHTQVNGIGTALLKKDEEMLNGSLNVTIHKMQGLDKPCEVYCCMEMDSYGHFYQKARTRSSAFTTDASWNQDFELDLDGSQTLRILCYRKQPGNDDVIIGKCALELSLSWLNSKFNEKTISMNDISITISIRHTPASKTLKRTQSKLRTGIFGVKIENATRRENKTVPSIVTACVQQVENRGIDEVGIYRVSGVTSEVQHFKKLFDKNTIAATVQAEEADIHAITGVLKLYFRELPEPLFTDEHYQSFIQTMQLQNEEGKEKCMLELLHCLPAANYYTIVFMIEHLVRVAKKSDVNKMSQSNLATIFGPTLMHPAMKDSNADPMAQMAQAAKDAGVQSEVVYFFLKLASSGKNIRKSAGSESPTITESSAL